MRLLSISLLMLALAAFVGCNATKDLDDIEIEQDRLVNGVPSPQQCDAACSVLLACGYVPPEAYSACTDDCNFGATPGGYNCVANSDCTNVDRCTFEDEGGGVVTTDGPSPAGGAGGFQ